MKARSSARHVTKSCTTLWQSLTEKSVRAEDRLRQRTGEVQIGEGVMSLRRAFRIAGAQTVLASHWKVSDKATSQLMTEFIRRGHSGEPRAKAWREAQLSLLHTNEFQNPYFWAAFTLTGQWR